MKSSSNILPRDKNGRTLLHLAIINRDSGEALRLIQTEANVNAQDTNDKTPLHIVAHDLRFDHLGNEKTRNNLTAVFEELIQYNADVNAKDNKGNTPLHEAASLGDSDKLETVKKLIQHKADVNALNNQGHSPLFSACSSRGVGIELFLLEGKYIDIINRKMVSDNIEVKADIGIKDINGNTIFHNIFVGLGRSDLSQKMDYLFRQCSKDLINATNNEGKTALYYAAFGPSEKSEGEQINLTLTANFIRLATLYQIPLVLSPDELERFLPAFEESLKNYSSKVKENLVVEEEKNNLKNILEFFSSDHKTYIKYYKILNSSTEDDSEVAGEWSIDSYLDVD